MNYQQLAQPDLSVIGRSGYCLEMQENVWGAEHWFEFAEQSWNNNGPNHPDELPPDVCVPVYWTYYDSRDDAEYGHVATWVPGRGVFSSTFNTALGSEVYPSIQAMTDRINMVPNARSRYLGWSEVIANLRIVKPQGGMLMTDQNLLTNYYQTLFGRGVDESGMATWIGKPADVVFQELILSDEYKAIQEREATQDQLYQALKDGKAAEDQEVLDLKAKITELNAKIAELSGQPAPGPTPDPTPPADTNQTPTWFANFWQSVADAILKALGRK